MYDADVFFHTYNNEKYNTAPWYGPNAIVKEGRSNFLPKLLELYNPKLYEINEGGPMPINLNKVPTNFRNVHPHTLNFSRSMFYSIKRVTELKKEYEEKNGFVYDFVIRLRFDLCINNLPRLKDIDSGVFYANNFMKPNDFYTLTEHVSISNSVLADLSGKTFDNYYIIAEKIGVGFENMWGYNIKCIYGAPICQDSRIRTKLVRDWSETDPDPESYYKLEV